jgi:hypothetical protein
MPRSSKALLPAEIRTRMWTGVHSGRYSHGLFCLSRVFLRCREIGFPISSLLHFHRFDLRRDRDSRYSRALPNTEVARPVKDDQLP